MEKGPNNERSPQELLQEFTATGRQEPFAEIVRRYAGMVFHVCHQVVKNTHDAEDVTQAVFLTLATQSKSTQIKYIGPWLQQVAYRLALDVRKSQKRREIREIKHFEISRGNGNGNGNGHAPPASAALDQSEMKSLVADELNKLPTKYRLPLILHYFGGMSRDEMARELRCKPSTLGVRLFRGREMLSERLAERGIVVGVGVVGVLLASVIRETISQNLQASVCHYATTMAAGHSVSSVLVPPHILGLAQTASRTLLVARIKAAAAATIIGATALFAGAEVVARVDVSGLLPKFLHADLKNLLQFKLPMPRLQAQPPQLSQVNPIHLDAAPINPRPLLGAERILANVAIEPVGTLDAWAPPSRCSSGAFTISGPLNIQQILGASSPVLAPPARALLDPLPATPAAASKDYIPSIHRFATGSSGGTSHTAEAVSPQASPSFSSGLIHLPANPDTNVYSFSGGGQRPVKDLALKPSPADGRSPGQVGSDTVASARPAPLELVSSAPVDESYVAAVDTGVIPLALVQRQLRSAQATEQTEAAKSSTFTRTAGQSASTYTNPYPTYQRRPWNNTDVTLAGWGNVDVNGIFDNSGQVIADGNGKLRTLNLGDAALITSSIENPPGGSSGWYAVRGGKLVLPPIHLARGQKSLTWGDSPADPLNREVNSVRLAFSPVTGGPVSISLLSPDRSDIPGLGAGTFLDVWSIDAGLMPLHNIDATIRLDSLMLGELGYADSEVMLWKYDREQWQPVAATDLSVDSKNHLLSGEIGDAGYFAISGPAQAQLQAFSARSTVVPEPSTLATLALGATLLLRRRHRA
ncbi:MAG: RNA polymerase sigma factor [Tepidisphaerales bacterium]